MTRPTSDVLDIHPDASVCTVALALLGRVRTTSGRIRTIRCFEDNALVKAAAAEAGHGDVLVVDGGGSLRTALMGDQVAGAAMANGWNGAILIGAVRDSDALRTLDFHIKALGASPCKSTKTGAGERDCVVEWGGVRFVPGQFVYSDADGIVVLAEAVG